MSWSELERLVDEAERQPRLRLSLRGCRDDADLMLRCRRLGFRITRVDLQRAWLEHQREQELAAGALSGGKGQRASC